MLNVILNRDDSIETVLPTLELAMQTGEVCRIRNINYLGTIHLAALALLAMSGSLMDTETGRIIHSHPGFCLVGVDDTGVARTLVP